MAALGYLSSSIRSIHHLQPMVHVVIISSLDSRQMMPVESWFLHSVSVLPMLECCVVCLLCSVVFLALRLSYGYRVVLRHASSSPSERPRQCGGTLRRFGMSV